MLHLMWSLSVSRSKPCLSGNLVTSPEQSRTAQPDAGSGDFSWTKRPVLVFGDTIYPLSQPPFRAWDKVRYVVWFQGGGPTSWPLCWLPLLSLQSRRRIFDGCRTARARSRIWYATSAGAKTNNREMFNRGPIREWFTCLLSPSSVLHCREGACVTYKHVYPWSPVSLTWYYTHEGALYFHGATEHFTTLAQYNL